MSAVVTLTGALSALTVTAWLASPIRMVKSTVACWATMRRMPVRTVGAKPGFSTRSSYWPAASA